MAEKDWSAFDKFDYRTVKAGGGRCWSGFTSDSRKELIGRSPVMAYELGTKPRAYRGSAVNGEGAAGCSIRVPCHTGLVVGTGQHTVKGYGPFFPTFAGLGRALGNVYFRARRK